jgi:hypothetical protein
MYVCMYVCMYKSSRPLARSLAPRLVGGWRSMCVVVLACAAPGKMQVETNHCRKAPLAADESPTRAPTSGPRFASIEESSFVWELGLL